MEKKNGHISVIIFKTVISGHIRIEYLNFWQSIYNKVQLATFLMVINLSFSNETFQYEAGRVIYSLFNASIIPSIIWIVQRLIGRKNYRDAYLRRRIFGYVILIDFLLYVLSVINAYKQINLPPLNFDFFITLLKDNLKNFWWWIPIFWFGFRNQSTREKGFFYAIWQKYKPEYFVSKERLESFRIK